MHVEKTPSTTDERRFFPPLAGRILQCLCRWPYWSWNHDMMHRKTPKLCSINAKFRHINSTHRQQLVRLQFYVASRSPSVGTMQKQMLALTCRARGCLTRNRPLNAPNFSQTYHCHVNLARYAAGRLQRSLPAPVTGA